MKWDEPHRKVYHLWDYLVFREKGECPFKIGGLLGHLGDNGEMLHISCLFHVQYLPPIISRKTFTYFLLSDFLTFFYKLVFILTYSLLNLCIIFFFLKNICLCHSCGISKYIFGLFFSFFFFLALSLPVFIPNFFLMELNTYFTFFLESSSILLF